MAVGFGGIEESHASVIRFSNHLDGRCFLGRRPKAKTKSHTTEPERRNLKTTLAQRSLLHTSKASQLSKEHALRNTSIFLPIPTVREKQNDVLCRQLVVFGAASPVQVRYSSI